MFETSWVVISVLYTGWNFFTLICCIVCLKRPKINEKEAGVGPFKKNQLENDQINRNIFGVIGIL